MSTWAQLPGLFRHWRQGGWTAALGIWGLAAAMAACLVIGQIIHYEVGYNGWVPDARHVWVVESHSNDMTSARPTPTAPFMAWNAIRADLPDTLGTRVNESKVAISGGAITTRRTLLDVDEDFFRVFPTPLVSGSLGGWMQHADAVVLSRQTAKRQFGAADPIGRTIRYVHQGRGQEGRVMAVVADPPANTDLHFDLIAHLSTTMASTEATEDLQHDWSYRGTRTYLRVASDAAAARVAAALPAIVARHLPQGTQSVSSYRIELSLARLTTVHLAAPEQRRTLAVFGFAALMLLLVATANSLNLMGAQTTQRAREMTLRRGLGARRGALFRLIMGETFADVLLAAFFGLALAEAALPVIDHIAGLTLTMRYGGAGGALILLASLVVVLTCSAGLWPAVSLSRAAGVAIRKRSIDAREDGRALFSREVLVTFQVLVMTVLAAAALVLCAQLWHVRHRDPGFQRDQLVVIRSLADKGLSEPKRRSMLAQLKQLPGVRDVAVASDGPGGGQLVSETLFGISGSKRMNISLREVEIEPGYFHLLGAHLVAGAAHTGGDSPAAGTSHLAVLNMAAVHALGVTSAGMAIGQTLDGAGRPQIVAVIDDMRFGSPHETVPPTIYRYTVGPLDTPLVLVRTDRAPQQAIPAMRDAWQIVAPHISWNAQSADVLLTDSLRNDKRMMWLLAIGALLSCMTAFIGLWAMTIRRLIHHSREIALRRMLGATSRELASGLMRSVLRPLLIGNLVAMPLAFLVMRILLEGFDDRMTYGTVMLPVAALISVVVGVCAAVGPILYALAMPPSRSLRHE
ncbi:MAG: FtsX-like permease family protein [Rhodanobacter sp.]